MRLSHLIPSMYQRRLLLLGLGLFLALFIPSLQLGRLTLVKGGELRAEAEKKLVNEQWLPTVRGRILDRKGRVLALDRPCFDIAVDYQVLTGQWAYKQAARRARLLHAAEWSQISPTERDVLIAACRPEFDARLDDMWNRFCAIASISRGELEEKIADIRNQVQSLATTVTEKQRLALQEKLNRGSETVVEVKTADVRRPIHEQTIPHVILRDVPEQVGFAFQRLEQADAGLGSDDGGGENIPLMPGLHVQSSGWRDYPLDSMDVQVSLSSFPAPLRQNATVPQHVEGVATHILGWMRARILKEDLERRPVRREGQPEDRGGYFPGDSVGASGVEAAAEDTLRGLRGLQTRHLDTGEIESVAPARGSDVPLTIDAMLQARIQALFNPALGLTIVQPWHKNSAVPSPEAGKPRELPLATPLNGAAVVIDIDTGEILALVSAPSFSHQALATSAASIFGDSYNMPYLNRAVNKPYPPGSIVKPLMLTSAVTAGKYSPDERIACTGHFFPNEPFKYRCWYYKLTNGASNHSEQFGHNLNGEEAIQVSCNIFFFEMGKRLGPRGIHDWYTRFGVGRDAEPWNLGIGPTYSGSLPDPAKSHTNDAILMGIGQGPIAWTPLHAADVYATIARGGMKVTPHIRLDVPVNHTDLHLSRRGVAQALAGLRAGVEKDHGTTHEVSFKMADGTKKTEPVFNVPKNITVWAKSGTADVAPFIADLTFDGEKEAFDGDHAWCVFLVGEGDHPRYAVSVVVDYGGSGGRVSGPVANQVIRALMAEGYLPDPSPLPTKDSRASVAH